MEETGDVEVSWRVLRLDSICEEYTNLVAHAVVLGLP